MNFIRIRRPALRVGTAVAVAGAFACLPSGAAAGVADYPSTATFGVPNNTGQTGIPAQAFVPPGRTAVESVELVNVMPSFGGGGGGDLQLRLKGPTGTEITLLSNSQCTSWPNTSAFTISDSAATDINTTGFCNTQLPAGAGRPTDPLSAFTGTPSGGAWTVTVVDIGVSGTLGSWNGWTLRLNHAPPQLTATRARLRIRRRLAVTATCDANCTVTTGGAARPTTTTLAANSPGLIVARPTRKALRRLRKGKAVSETLTATDETGGTATATVRLRR